VIFFEYKKTAVKMKSYNYERAIADLLGDPEKKKGTEWNYFNPLDDDGENPDFWVNIESGLFHCFSSEDEGHFTRLYADMNKINEKQAFKELRTKYPANGSSTYQQQSKSKTDYDYIYSKKLSVNVNDKKKIIESLMKRYIQEDYIKFLIKDGQIKYDSGPKYTTGLVVPVYNSKNDKIVAIQKIAPDFKKKKFHGSFKAEGAGYWITPDGWQKQKDTKNIYIVESFINAATLGMSGHKAICVFSANNTNFPKELFNGYDKIVIGFDNDSKGEKGAEVLSHNLELAGCENVFVLTWPKGTSEKFDVNDLLMKNPVNFEDEFKKLLEKVKPAKDLIKPITKEKKQKKKFNAHEILAKINTKDFLYVPDVGFYNYDSAGYWKEINKTYVESKIKEIIGEPSRYEIAETSKMLELDTLIPLGKKLNELKWTLNLQNGLMEIETGEIKPHDRELYSTIQLPVVFNPESKCPKWDKFLIEIVESQELVKVLQEFIGLCLIPETKFHKALVLVGSGANGKSTFLSVIEYLLGKKNISSVPMGKLESEFHRASLYNKLLNISSELEINELMGSGYFKSIVSGDTIDAAFKFRDSFTFKPFARLIFAMNELPKCRDRSYGFYRRLLIVPFYKEFKGKEADRTLGKKLIEEMDGIFNWALAGLKHLFEQDHFTESKTLDDMLEKYKKDNNPVMTFIEDYCFINTEVSTEKNKIYKTYKDEFCKNNGYKSFGNSQFFKELKRQVPQISENQSREDGVRIRVLNGISLRNNG
tara:strand:- start:127 stop:2409 length:2283 start_codon:yes stop_codon:yes gene_type:complete